VDFKPQNYKYPAGRQRTSRILSDFLYLCKPKKIPLPVGLNVLTDFLKRMTMVLLIVTVAGVLTCSCSRKVQPITDPHGGSNRQTGGTVMATPPCIIYKTRSDYSHNVAVILSDDKSRITSYPDVSDIVKQGERVYPTALAGGFLLDNRGIGPQVAFLSITYEEFMHYPKTPFSDDLFRLLVDTDPLVEMYQCGTRYQYTDFVSELNQIITTGNFPACKKLK